VVQTLCEVDGFAPVRGGDGSSQPASGAAFGVLSEGILKRLRAWLLPLPDADKASPEALIRSAVLCLAVNGWRSMDATGDGNLDSWKLSAEEHNLSVAKSSANRLDFALLLKFFQNHGRFPSATSAITAELITEVAQQLGVEPSAVGAMSDRTLERARAEIRNLCGYREATVEDAERLTEWLRDQIVVIAPRSQDGMFAALEAECRGRRIEPPSAERIDRIVRSAIRAHEERLCNATLTRLPSVSRARLDALLQPGTSIDDADSVDHRRNGDILEAGTSEASSTSARGALINQLRSDAGRPGVNSLRREMAKLQVLRELELPDDLFAGIPLHELEVYCKRVAVEEPHELRRHPKSARLTWLAAFAVVRGRAVTDNLVDLLVETIHRINARAERRVEHELLEDLKRVSGKQSLLFQVADVALAHPDGIVRDVVFPIVSEIDAAGAGQRVESDRTELSNDIARFNSQFV